MRIYKTEVVSYLDRLTDKTVISTFNEIVKLPDFQSFFIDDLMAYYENRMSETIDKNQKDCENKFSYLEIGCNSLLNGDIANIEIPYNNFEKALKEWDDILQPLQVNAQQYGGSDKISADFVHDLRNRVVSICNRSQERVMLQIQIMERSSLQIGYGQRVLLEAGKEARDRLPAELESSIKVLDVALKLSRLFINVFAEIDQSVELLRDDINTLTNLKSQTSTLKKQVDDAKAEAVRRTSYYRPTVKSGGCYIATCVYGSYDCPEVWTLRRYRDHKLAKTWYGRLFIHIYYAISPTMVKLFGKTKWFQKLWRNKLDRMVNKLHEEGFEDTPYNDIEW